MKKIMEKRLNIKVEGKKQILLCNTNREAKNFLKSLEVRRDGNYQKIPHFLVEKTGKIHELSNDDVKDHFLCGYVQDNDDIIVICLENLGWLKRRNKDGKYVTWLGDIYKSKVYEKKWRGKLYWDTYPPKQMNKTVELIEKICENKNIPKRFIGHNVLVEGVEHFSGIVSRSNYNEYWMDINPSFNFELI